MCIIENKSTQSFISEESCPVMNSKCSYWRSVANWNRTRKTGMISPIATPRLMSDDFKWNSLVHKYIVTGQHLLCSLNWFHSSLCPRCIDWWYLSIVFAEETTVADKVNIALRLAGPRELNFKDKRSSRRALNKKKLGMRKGIHKNERTYCRRNNAFLAWGYMFMMTAFGRWKQKGWTFEANPAITQIKNNYFSLKCEWNWNGYFYHLIFIPCVEG